MWRLYDELIADAASDDRIERVDVGSSWTMVKTQRGRIGVAASHLSVSGRPADGKDYAGMSLAEAAALVKSWNFAEAAVGLAAINSQVNIDKHFPTDDNTDAFFRYRDRIIGKKVAVIGRFAYLEKRVRPIADLYVIERKPDGTDYPDPACEYLLPEMDAVFITGSAIPNKTMPRLLQLCRGRFTGVSGPSTVMNRILLDYGADALCGFCVTDETACRAAVSRNQAIFGCGRMVCMEK